MDIFHEVIHLDEQEIRIRVVLPLVIFRSEVLLLQHGYPFDKAGGCSLRLRWKVHAEIQPIDDEGDAQNGKDAEDDDGCGRHQLQRTLLIVIPRRFRGEMVLDKFFHLSPFALYGSTDAAYLPSLPILLVIGAIARIGKVEGSTRWTMLAPQVEMDDLVRLIMLERLRIRRVIAVHGAVLAGCAGRFLFEIADIIGGLFGKARIR